MRSKLLRSVALSVMLVGSGMALYPLVAQEAVEEVVGPRDAMEVYADLNLFGEVFDRIRAEYVDAPDERELIRAAIQGMLTSLDPHSAYLSPDSFVDMEQTNRGTFGGLGIEVTMEEGVVKVISPIDDTAADRAGILPDDFIVEIGGEEVFGLTLDEAVSRMKGEIGTSVDITVVREGATEPLEFNLERAAVPQRVVRWSLEGDVGIMRLAQFTAQAYPGIRNAIEDMFEERDGVAPTGLILDLRQNPGGLVDQAVLVSDAFLDGGGVLITRGRDDTETQRYNAAADPIDEMIADVPLVVLINGGSASAAEIVAGALQDHRRAVIVGTRSYGKGTVQSIIGLGANGESGAMRLTTQRYYTPNNRSIQAAGIMPDIEILQEIPVELIGRVESMGEAGLAGEIGGGTEERATTASSVYVPADPAEDLQLQYAIRLINGEETNPAFPPPGDTAALGN